MGSAVAAGSSEYHLDGRVDPVRALGRDVVLSFVIGTESPERAMPGSVM